MWHDEIVEEIHRIREEHAKSFNYDLEAMFADWQKKQAASGRQIISKPLKQPLQRSNNKVKQQLEQDRDQVGLS